MTLPQCLEPIRMKALQRGWLLGKVPYGSSLDSSDGRTRTFLAAPSDDGAYVYHRYHTEAADYAVAELTAELQDTLREQAQKDKRQRAISKRAGERRSRKRTGA